MKKKIVLLSIIIFPSLIYFVFELTQANFKKMAYFGPKTVNAEGDTVYWSVPDIYFRTNAQVLVAPNTDTSLGGNITSVKSDSMLIDTISYPVYVILFLDKNLKKEGYKLPGIYDYVKYKSKDINEVPIIIVSDFNEFLNGNSEFDSLQLTSKNFHSFMIDLEKREQFLKATYFKQKPAHVFDYFMVLVDKKRHIRGYYDPTFNAEVKRMIQEYKHLKIRDEYAETQKQNDIKQK